MKTLRAALLIAFFTAPSLYAQPILNLEFPHLSSRAAETVDVTLDGSMLRLASSFLANDPNEKDVAQLVRGLTGIYVRSYSFDRDNSYTEADVEKVRRQLGPAWKRIITVRSRTRENVEIYTRGEGDAMSGLVIVAAEPREFTVVNLVGRIDLDRLAALEGQFGIPEMTTSKERK